MWVTVENFHQKDADSFKRLPTIEFFGALIIWGTYFFVQNYKKNGFILDIDELFCGKPQKMVIDIDELCAKLQKMGLFWILTNFSVKNYKKNGFILDIDELFCGKPQQKMG